MRTVGLLDAKQKLSELVKRASEGERIGITRRGKLVALIVSAPQQVSVEEIFRGISKIQRRVRHTKRISLKRLIEEGRA